jgi:hypothetical protein
MWEQVKCAGLRSTSGRRSRVLQLWTTTTAAVRRSESTAAGAGPGGRGARVGCGRRRGRRRGRRAGTSHGCGGCGRRRRRRCGGRKARRRVPGRAVTELESAVDDDGGGVEVVERGRVTGQCGGRVWRRRRSRRRG